MLFLFAAVYLGWALGANDTANVFGTGVANELISYRAAVILTAGFVIFGAIIEGPKMMNTVGQFTTLTLYAAFIAVLSAAIIVTVMTSIKLPVSTSQATLGAIAGIALSMGGWNALPREKLIKIVLCWLFTPLGAMAISVALFIILAPLANRIRSFITFALVMKLGVIVVGCYGAYTLGANNVANVTGAFVGAGLLGPSGGAIIGGAAIALGALTYSKGVMMSVGKKIFPLGSFSAFIAVLASALTLHFFTQLRVPVSNSQAIVGSIAGIGLLRGTKAVDKKMLFRIFTGWVATPFFAAGLSFTLLAL